MSRHPHLPWVLAAALLLPGAAAHAADATLFVGVGARIAQREVSPVYTARAAIPVAPLLALSLAVDGDLAGAVPEAPFAGWRAGLVLDLPVPGPLTPELGLSYGPAWRRSAESAATVRAEVGLRSALGILQARLGWSRPLWSAAAPPSDVAPPSQLTFSVGVGL